MHFTVRLIHNVFTNNDDNELPDTMTQRNIVVKSAGIDYVHVYIFV